MPKVSPNDIEIPFHLQRIKTEDEEDKPSKSENDDVNKPVLTDNFDGLVKFQSMGFQNTYDNIYGKLDNVSAKESALRDHQRKRSHKINNQQTMVLVNYMCEHRNFALGKFDCPGEKVASERQWKVLQNLLSEHGPPKSVEQWKKAWKDIRGRTRAKMARLHAERARAGNIPHITPPLTEMEKKVISLISTKTSVPLIESEGELSTTVRETNETEETEEDCAFLDGEEVYKESAAPEEAESEQHSSHLGDNRVPQRKKQKGFMGELSELKDKIDSVDERSVTALESIASSLKIIAEGQKEIVALLRKAVEQIL